jgi:hypothetical protein
MDARNPSEATEFSCSVAVLLVLVRWSSVSFVGRLLLLVFLARLIPAAGISCVSAPKYLITMSVFFCAWLVGGTCPPDTWLRDTPTSMSWDIGHVSGIGGHAGTLVPKMSAKWGFVVFSAHSALNMAGKNRGRRSAKWAVSWNFLSDWALNERSDLSDDVLWRQENVWALNEHLMTSSKFSLNFRTISLAPFLWFRSNCWSWIYSVSAQLALEH